jgi:hypothetical protein
VSYFEAVVGVGSAQQQQAAGGFISVISIQTADISIYLTLHCLLSAYLNKDKE